jgi:DNA-binding beta-propeller fold protein YncE
MPCLKAASIVAIPALALALPSASEDLTGEGRRARRTLGDSDRLGEQIDCLHAPALLSIRDARWGAVMAGRWLSGAPTASLELHFYAHRKRERHMKQGHNRCNPVRAALAATRALVAVGGAAALAASDSLGRGKIRVLWSRRTDGTARAVSALLVVGAAWLTLAGQAGAAPGQIGYDGCFASLAAQGCRVLPDTSLGGARGVAVSPDGRSVYVASPGSDSIAHFFRGGPLGQLAYDGCLANTAAQGCGDLPGAPLGGADAVAVSPDGRSVYVASRDSDSIAHFFRSPEGKIAYDGCLANDDAQGCANLPGAPLNDANGVAVSPDGRSVYVASADSDSIAHFFRALGDDPPPGSVTTPGTRRGGQGGRMGFGSKTLIRLRLAAKRITARGPVPIVVSNANGFPVGGGLSGETAKAVAAKPKRRRLKLKTRTLRVAANRETTVKLRLPPTLGRLFKRNGKLMLRLKARVRDPAGNARTVTKTLAPRLKRKHKRTAVPRARSGTVGCSAREDGRQCAGIRAAMA